MLRTFSLALLLLGIAAQLHAEPKPDWIIVNKKARTMELMHAGRVLKTVQDRARRRTRRA